MASQQEEELILQIEECCEGLWKQARPFSEELTTRTILWLQAARAELANA